MAGEIKNNRAGDDIYEGQYVDFPYTEEEKEAISAGEGTHFFDANIIPTVQYQVFGLDNVWFWDDEGQNYSEVPSGSEILVQTVVGTRTRYYNVDELNNGDGVQTGTTLPDVGQGKTKELGEGKRVRDINLNDPDDPNYPTDGDPSVGDVYYTESDNEGTTEYEYIEVEGTMTKVDNPTSEEKNRAKKLTSTPEPETGGEDYQAPINSKKGEVYYSEEEILSPEEDGDGGDPKSGSKNTREGKDGTPKPSEPGDEGDDEETAMTPYEFNKYLSEPGKVAKVTITPSAELSREYPYAIVTINGKEYDLNYLNKPLELYMDRDYRISINWLWGQVVETFRIICNR